MRGRKIKATFQDPAGVAETPADFPTGDKYVGVDDTDLEYKMSVTWECFPHNIEIMFDTDTYFMEYEVFPESGRVDNETVNMDFVQ